MNNGVQNTFFETATLLSSFLATTTWLPKSSAFDALYRQGNVTQNELFNHSIEEIDENTNNGKYYVRVEDGGNVIEYECNLKNPHKFVESPDIAPTTNVSCCFVAVV
jgi:hypothetical protein